jgi:hypothetical protein
MTEIIENFASLTEYLNVIGKREPNYVFRNNNLSSRRRSSSYFSSTLTNSYEECVEIATKGYKEGLDKIKAEGTRIRHIGKANKNIPITDVVGFAPHVPNAITGVPKAMINTTKVEHKAKVITFLYSPDGDCSDNASKFINAGENMLNLIITLETQGYRVGLNTIVSFCGFDQWAHTLVQIKDWRQPINPLKIAYPFVHPSFMRRNGFRWLETHPDITDNYFESTYGRPIKNTLPNREEIAEHFRKNGILKKDWFYIDMKDAVNATADDLVRIMGIKSS